MTYICHKYNIFTLYDFDIYKKIINRAKISCKHIYSDDHELESNNDSIEEDIDCFENPQIPCEITINGYTKV